MENGRFRKITQRSINGIKNHSIWISNRGKSKSEVGRNFQNRKEHKSKLKSKLRQIKIIN